MTSSLPRMTLATLAMTALARSAIASSSPGEKASPGVSAFMGPRVRRTWCASPLSSNRGAWQPAAVNVNRRGGIVTLAAATLERHTRVGARRAVDSESSRQRACV